MRNLFWDSCVFNAFLYDEKHIYDVDSIVQYLDEARQRQFRIYTSSIILTEIAASKIKARGVGSGMDFINDLMGVCVVIDASVNILNLAGQLRDLPYRKHQSGKRKLTTGDAIMLASALHLEEAYGARLSAFHTFDDGGTKGEVPLLSYHEWCEGFSGAQLTLARRVIDLPRMKPVHPAPKLKM